LINLPRLCNKNSNKDGSVEILGCLKGGQIDLFGVQDSMKSIDPLQVAGRRIGAGTPYPSPALLGWRNVMLYIARKTFQRLKTGVSRHREKYSFAYIFFEMVVRRITRLMGLVSSWLFVNFIFIAMEGHDRENPLKGGSINL